MNVLQFRSHGEVLHGKHLRQDENMGGNFFFMQKRAQRLMPVLLIFVMLLAAPAIHGKQSTPQTIEIGAILPLTGDAAPYAKAAQQAIQLALDEVNGEQEHGIHRKPVRVIYEDSRLDPKTAASAATKLITVDRVKAIIGPMASAEVEAVLPIAERHGVVIISPAATSHGLSGKKGFFRTIVSDVYDGTAMAEFAYKVLAYRSVPTLYVEASGPAGVARSFMKRFKELGGNIPLTETGKPNDTDFRTQLTKIKAIAPKAVYFAAYPVESATILKQAKELGLHTQMLSHQLVDDKEVRERADDAANGVIYTTPKLDPESGGPAVRSFYDKFIKAYGTEPRNFASNSYDACRILIGAIKNHGDSYESIKAGILATRDYQGASGTFSFDANGDIVQQMRVMQIQGGKVAEFQPK